MARLTLEGIILNVDYVTEGKRGIIRIAFKDKHNVYELFDLNFYPYFYIVPSNDRITIEDISNFKTEEGGGAEVKKVTESKMYLLGKEVKVFKIEVNSPREVPILSEALSDFGVRYEHDIVFWKRYIIDKNVLPLLSTIVEVHEENDRLIVDEIRNGGNADIASLDRKKLLTFVRNFLRYRGMSLGLFYRLYFEGLSYLPSLGQAREEEEEGQP